MGEISGVRKVAHTRLPSVGFRSWSRFFAVSLQMTWVINPAYRLPLLSARPAVTHATLKRAATNFAAWWTEAQWVWTVCLRLLPVSVAIEPGTSCAWVQHADHSATEPPNIRGGANVQMREGGGQWQRHARSRCVAGNQQQAAQVSLINCAGLLPGVLSR